MRDIVKPAVTLFTVCIIVSVCLAFTFSVTKAKIDERAEIDSANARREVLAEVDNFEKLEGIKSEKGTVYIKEVYEGFKDGKQTGYVFTVVSKGYGGEIEVIIGIDSSRKVTGVKLGNNNETPGLGSKAKDAPFINQFDNLAPKEALEVVKGKKSKAGEIEAISGATITSRAVTEAVQAALETAASLEKKGGA